MAQVLWTWGNDCFWAHGLADCSPSCPDRKSTIGQPDAGALTTGDFELTGGFWFAVVAGDCNEDGGVNPFDYDAFEACLSGPSSGSIDPGCA